MLRECIRHEPLAKIILWSEQFYDFFRYVEMSTFDIASDAFATFKVTFKNLNSKHIYKSDCFPIFVSYSQLPSSGNKEGVLYAFGIPQVFVVKPQKQPKM